MYRFFLSVTLLLAVAFMDAGRAGAVIKPFPPEFHAQQMQVTGGRGGPPYPRSVYQRQVKLRVCDIRLSTIVRATAILAIALPVMAQRGSSEMRLTPAEIASLPTETAGVGTSGLQAVTTTIL